MSSAYTYVVVYKCFTSVAVCFSEFAESWVDVHYQNGSNSSDNSSSGQASPKNDQFQQSGLYTPLNIEKLLQDAQRESEQNSRETSTRTRYVVDK
jgi:hypothetical protein